MNRGDDDKRSVFEPSTACRNIDNCSKGNSSEFKKISKAFDEGNRILDSLLSKKCTLASSVLLKTRKLN